MIRPNITCNSFPNNADGAIALVRETCQAILKHHLDSVAFGLEVTGFYAWHLALYLNGVLELRPFYPRVYMFNPKVIKNFNKTLGDLPETDWKDAWVIANRVRIGQLLKPFDPDERYLPPQRLTRQRYHLIHRLTREKNCFLSYLFLKYSCSLKACPPPVPWAPVLHLWSPSSTPPKKSPALRLRICSWLKKAGTRISDAVGIARELKRAAAHSYRLPDKLKDPINRIMASTLQSIRHLQRQVKEMDKAIGDEMAGLANPLLSIPGMGPVFTAGIIAEIGSINNFPDDDAVAKFAGLTWRDNQSGDFEGEDTPLSKTGNAYLRYYLVEAANCVRMHGIPKLLPAEVSGSQEASSQAHLCFNCP